MNTPSGAFYQPKIRPYQNLSPKRNSPQNFEIEKNPESEYILADKGFAPPRHYYILVRISPRPLPELNNP